MKGQALVHEIAMLVKRGCRPSLETIWAPTNTFCDAVWSNSCQTHSPKGQTCLRAQSDLLALEGAHQLLVRPRGRLQGWLDSGR